MNNFSFYKDGKAFYCLFFLGFFLTFSSLYAKNSFRHISKIFQQYKIQGTITDGINPLPGVTIAIKNKLNTSIVSDYSGQYALLASPYDTLVVSFIGFKTVLVPINNRKTVDIQLQFDTTTLQEVKVNAGYYSVKESERTGSIAKITSKDIEKQPVSNVLATMQGRMAGVNIVQTTGVPGGGFDIQIRGQNSLRLSGNNPLYIIDGVPYSSDPIGTGINSAVLPTQPNPLNSINPDQIESIEVLKDADATAIYGSRGANGVVLVTTKKGKSGKTKFSAKLSTGTGTVTRFMDLMNTQQYLEMRREAFANDGISPPDYAYDVNGTWDQSRYTDWQKELLGGTALITDIQTSLSGGSEQTQFLLSGNFNKQTTVFPGDFHYKKANLHLNVNHESENKKFRTSISVGYTMQNNNQPRMDLMREAVNMSPNAPALYNPDGTLNWENNTFNNPLRNLEGKYKADTNDLIANAMLSYKLTDKLELKSSFGYTALGNSETTANPSTRYNPAFGLGPEFSTLIVSGADRSSWIIEPQLNWYKTIGQGKIDILVGGTFQSQQSNQLVQYASGFPSNSLIYNLASASNIFTMVSDETQYKYQAFFGRVNYNWQEKYIINLTGRRDGSSRFGPADQFATFGAVGAAWLFSKENIFKNSTVLSFGKLRTSYGLTGNDQIGDYQYMDTYASTGINYGGTIGLQPTRLFNPNFGWETNRKFEVALETGFFNDRIFITAAWYSNKSSNQLTGIPLPGITGFPTLQANLDATVQNRGTELTLRTVNIQRKDFNWSTNFNLTIAKNKLLEFPNLESSTYANQYVIGESLNIQKVYHFTDVDKQTGFYTFEDDNGDGQLTATEDKKTIKDFSPEYYGGLQNTLKYKRWQLDFLFQFVKQINYNQSIYFGVPGSGSNQPVAALERWQKAGDSKPYPIYTDGTNSAAVDAYYKYFESDGAISDASYIRLKNISISYELPLKDLQCRVFFEGQNVLTFTKYKGADPEFKSSGYLPPLRVLSAGIQFSF
ncbi:SusC/RagA family TonB-linked outer membrane protein [Flavobacterium sp. IB48]|uniref:SusC/RagA family TonB-linked outer membrane protein n=1 Tax=Flavobacterium sp. IB48 TaxID=2779375 RepID=UPI0018E74087|nr:SusC/RagA family TonB-linked outer membrane protein [Flavobacterium sp. IB48]MBJ2126355.1 SusC/RagA family TonB-linked outer membrane protein [Flavobacterium sp. IB48]